MHVRGAHAEWRGRRIGAAVVAAMVMAGGFVGAAPVAQAAAGDPGSPDTTFNTNVGTSLGGSREVYAVAGQSDGKAVAGGSFGTSNSAVSNRIARFNADGTPDTTFNTNASSLLDGSVEDLAIQSDGKIVIVGAFNSAAGTGGGCRYVARLNSSGTVDTSFCTSYANAIGASANSVAIRSSDGAIIVGGSFTSPSNYVALLNADGSPAAAFNSALGVNLKQPVYAVGITSTGMVLAGGATDLLGASTGAVAAVNSDGTLTGSAGTFNTAFGNSVTGTVRALAVQSDDKVVIGGDFSSPGRNIARFGADGSADTTFNTNATTVNLGGPVQDLVIDSSGRIPVAGSFSGYFTRLLSTGAFDSTFTNPGVGFTAYAVATPTNSKILLGGAFTTPGRYLVRFLGEAAGGPLTFSSGAFPAATVGSAASLTVTVTNSGAGPATPSAITVTGTGLTNGGTGTCATSSAIAASATCTVVITWTPSAAGSLSGASLDIAYPGGTAASNSLTLTGTATASGGGGGGSSGGGSSDSPPPAPSPSTSPVLPPLDPQGATSGLTPGQDAVTVGGQVVPVVVRPNGSNTGLDVDGPGWALALEGLGPGGSPAPLGPNGVLRLVRGERLAAQGSGFKPGTPVRIYLFSDPLLLGVLTTDASGAFAGEVDVPAGITIGPHTAQVNGYTTDDQVRSVSLGVEVVKPAATTTSVGTRVYFRFESAMLTAATKRTLRALVAQVPAGSESAATVIGIVQAQSPTPKDWRLAKARARNVARYMTRVGLPGTVTIRARRVPVANIPNAWRVAVTVRITR